MSCSHGNHESACVICEEVEAAFNSGFKAGLAGYTAGLALDPPKSAADTETWQEVPRVSGAPEQNSVSIVDSSELKSLAVSWSVNYHSNLPNAQGDADACWQRMVAHIQQQAKAIADIAVNKATAHMVPLSTDGNSVFLDGIGVRSIEHSDSPDEVTAAFDDVNLTKSVSNLSEERVLFLKWARKHLPGKKHKMAISEVRSPSVHPDWTLVPKTATTEMLIAGVQAWTAGVTHMDALALRYSAMLAEVPTYPGAIHCKLGTIS